jgi:hypothetical protein
MTYVASYIILEPDNQCGVGLNIKRCYVDENYDGKLNSGEHFCDQEILVEYHPSNLTFNIPPDITIHCLEDIPDPNATHSGGSPCDVIGSHTEDKDFTVGPGECHKIIRKYTFLNWCTYAPKDPNWNGEGLYEFTQTIKIVDKDQPVLSHCAHVEFGVGANCETEVTLTNSAIDVGACPSTELEWRVELDLWADGTFDYTFGFDQPGIFKTEPTGNDDEIEILIPELLGIGNHKVKWNVRDACGNWRTCLTTFSTVDNKPPTPYCHSVIFASFDGSNDQSVDVPADLFNLGSFDNCSAPEKVQMAYSADPENDTLNINCINSGFQFLNIHAIDKAGNSDFCRTFLLIFDNGSCNSRIAAQGRVTSAANEPLTEVGLMIMRPGEAVMESASNIDGEFDVLDIPMYNDISFIPSLEGLDRSRINLLDYIMLVDGLLGKTTIDGIAPLAADLNGDKRITPADLKLLKYFILKRTHQFDTEDWSFIPNQDLENWTLRNHSGSLDFIDYSGSLDFIGVMKGDVSGQTLDSAIINRSILEIDINVQNTEDGLIAISLDQDIDAKGFQFNLDLKHFDHIVSGQIDLSNDDFELVGNTLEVLLPQGKYKAGSPLFYIAATELKNIAGIGYSDDLQEINLNRVETRMFDEISIFPNPAISEINIAGLNNEVRFNIEIIDISGKVVYESSNQSTVNIADLNSGSYLVRVETNDQVSINKIVKL